MARWELGAWQAPVLEARAHVVRAEGSASEYMSLLHEAARQFTIAGHARDAARCARKADELRGRRACRTRLRRAAGRAR